MLHSCRDPRNPARRGKSALNEKSPDSKPDRSSKSEQGKGSKAWERFQSYYREQLRLPDEELEVFFRTMQTPLPVTFRLVLPTGASSLVIRYCFENGCRAAARTLTCRSDPCRPPLPRNPGGGSVRREADGCSG
jgi:hypothetical protein